YVRSHQKLSDNDMQQVNGRLAHLADEMDIRMSRTLNRAGEELTAAVHQLAAAKMDNEYLDVAKKLQDVDSQLASRGLFALSVAQEIDYLNEIELSARVALARLGTDEMAHRLAERGEAVMARGMSNIDQEFQIENAMAARFKDMDDQIAKANRIVGDEAAMASRTSLAREVGATANALNAAEATFR